jgi:hypothetical protein
MVKTAAKEESLFENEARFGLLEITPLECVKLCFLQWIAEAGVAIIG